MASAIDDSEQIATVLTSCNIQNCRTSIYGQLMVALDLSFIENGQSQKLTTIPNFGNAEKKSTMFK